MALGCVVAKYSYGVPLAECQALRKEPEQSVHSGVARQIGGETILTEQDANQRFCPRLSEAKQLLPLLSHHLETATREHPHCAALELWPLVEDGLFGYELVPDRETHTYLVIGRNAEGEPAVRTVLYGVRSDDAPRLIAVNGRLLSREERATHYSVQVQDTVFADWTAAANFACARLRVLFPHNGGESAVRPTRPNQHLEDALGVAHSHLARWDPFIAFFGLPNEAELGFALVGDSGRQGELTFRQPSTWTLRWSSLDEAVNESWSTAMNRRDVAASRERDRRHSSDRRTHRRRATDRGDVSPPWLGNERRQTPERRAMDQGDR